MLLKLYDKNNNPQDLQRIIDILNDGGLIIYPTDTMYAIGCHGLKERAIERICRIKEIDPRKNNLSIICYDLSSISEYAKVDNNVFKLMKHNLPGPFTFILNGTAAGGNNEKILPFTEPERGRHPYAEQQYHPGNCPSAGRSDNDHHLAIR